MERAATQMSSITENITAAAELGEQAAALVRPDLPPAGFISLLLEQQLFPDAVRFLAHALPKREAVWWAWICAKRSAGENPKPAIRAALDATEQWIAQPTEAHRRAAKAAADEAGMGVAAGCAGLAAFFSGGSLAPPEAPPVPPGEYLTAKAVSGAVIFAAVSQEPAKAPEKFRAFVAQGMDVTNRIRLWEPKQN
jgi:hypothetical protein